MTQAGLQSLVGPFDRYILTETMVVHLFPHAYVSLIDAGGGAGQFLACVAPEGVVDMYAGQEIPDASCS